MEKWWRMKFRFPTIKYSLHSSPSIVIQRENINYTLSSSVVPNLFLPVAHFHFENFPWPYSLKVLLELDPNFHQSWIRLKRFFRSKTGDFQKKNKKKQVFTKIQTVFPAKYRWSPPKKTSQLAIHRNFQQAFGQCHRANTTFSNQNAPWPTAKYFCGPPMGHGPQVENQWSTLYR